MTVRNIKQVNNLSGKRVLLRVDFNVPIKNRVVKDDFKLRQSVPTVKYLLERKAKIILITHLGRPDGKIVSGLKIDSLLKLFSKIIGKKIIKLETGDWNLTDRQKLNLLRKLDSMKNSSLSMMENIRFSPDEKNDSGKLSRQLAALADIFVLDGFAVAHRASASVAGVPKYMDAYAGLLLQKEIKNLHQVIFKPKKPLLAIMGGAKVKTKVPVIKNLMDKADHIIVAGALANTCLKAGGYHVGRSLVDDSCLKETAQCLKNSNIITPVDVIVGKKNGKDSKAVVVGEDKKICNKNQAIYDIGPRSLEIFQQYIDKAKTLVWNGPVGYFEQKPYDIGTLSIARMIGRRCARQSVFGVVGGGETRQALMQTNVLRDLDFVSTGGGAMLEFLSGKQLPGLKAISKD